MFCTRRLQEAFVVVFDRIIGDTTSAKTAIRIITRIIAAPNVPSFLFYAKRASCVATPSRRASSTNPEIVPTLSQSDTTPGSYE